MYADAGVLSGWSCETDTRAYGLNDPSLEGFPGSIFKIVSAPFRVSLKATKFAVKKAVKVAPGVAIGFATGGPAGAIAGGSMSLVKSFQKKGEEEQLPFTQFTRTPIQSVGSYPRSNPALNPYGVQAQPYPQSALQYQEPYQAPARSVGDQLASVAALLRDELLAAGARRVVATPAGAAAVREKVTGDIGRYLLPISIGAGALILVLAMTRKPRAPVAVAA